MNIPATFIVGNCDREVLEQRKGVESAVIPEQFREIMRWVAGQLDGTLDKWIAAWPKTVRAEVGQLGNVLFCHATPRSDTEMFSSQTSEARLLPIFAGIDEPIVVCGHTHRQFDRMLGTTRVVNAGSVGMPFGATGAYWLLLGPDVELRRTDYDLESAAARIGRTNYPGANEFAQNYVLSSPR